VELRRVLAEFGQQLTGKAGNSFRTPLALQKQTIRQLPAESKFSTIRVKWFGIN
jgi:hypothetical protein